MPHLFARFCTIPHVSLRFRTAQPHENPLAGTARPDLHKTVPVRLRVDRTTILLSCAFGLGLSLIILGLSAAQTGREAQRLPASIASINPGPGDSVLRQSQIVVKFADAFDAVLVVDGLELTVTRLDELTAAGGPLPDGAQIALPPTAIYDPGNFTISFLPQDGAEIEGFGQGRHTATVIYWKVDESRDRARSFTWEFSVS